MASPHSQRGGAAPPGMLKSKTMFEFFRAGGVFMIFLLATSVVGLAFIIERGWALRWARVIPPEVENAAHNCHGPEQLSELREVCQSQPSSLSRLLLTAEEHLQRPRQENIDAIETRARHEVLQLERGLVVLEIVVGIAPLLGLVGTIHGLIRLFGDLSRSGLGDNSVVAAGIAIALNTTLMGLLIAIPSLIAWSYYNKKVETLTVEMETLCDEFVRRHYSFVKKARP
jgi:biopolymer transport protein ExbB